LPSRSGFSEAHPPKKVQSLEFCGFSAAEMILLKKERTILRPTVHDSDDFIE
jgi:hypothetical protein